MANRKKSYNRGYAFLDNCTIDELENLLRLAAKVTPVDEGYLAALEAAILRRESSLPTGRLSDADLAWEKFRSNYLAADADQYDLSKEVDVPENMVPMSRRYRRPRRVRRVLLIAAVIVVLMTLLLPPVMGYRDIFQMVAQWNDEKFKFVPPAYGTPGAVEESDNTKPTSPLTESMKEHNLPLSFAPTWFPEDRHLMDVDYRETEFGDIYYSAYFFDKNGERLILYKLIKYSLSDSATWEKDAGEVIEFNCGGVTHYLITNNGLVGAHWCVGQYEAAISGHITLDEAKAVIESIYER